MKQLYIYFCLLLIPVVLPGNVASQVTPGDPGNFITIWKTDNTGTSDIDQIIIPTTGIGYDYDVYWEDINDASINGALNDISGDLTITFPGAGSYQVEISGAFPRIYFYNDNNPSDAGKLLSIEQWGSIAWLSMQQAFYGCSNLQVTATDAPDLSQVTSMSEMFSGATSLNADFNSWNVSNITDMTGLFSGAMAFNGAIGSWSVSNVQLMGGMFFNAHAFNQPIGSWNVGNVTNMVNMFSFAMSFNQPLENWNVGNVMVMGGMFRSSPFNQDIGGWDVSNVTNLQSMFSGANAFDQDISGWNVSGVTNMRQLFQNATAFNQDLGGWNIGSVTDMEEMLDNTALSILNYDATLVGWEGQSIQQNVPLGAQGLEYCAGEAARDELINTHGWTITGDAKSASTCVNPFSFITVWSTNDNQFTVPTFPGETYDYDVYWKSLLNPANEGTLTGQTGDAVINVPAAGIYEVEITGLFPRIYFNNGGDTEKLTSIEQWGNNAWTSMEAAFFGCSNLEINATDDPNLSGVTSMSEMFRGAFSLNSDLNHWNVSNVTNMDRMFQGATVFNGNITGWDVSGVTDMLAMFTSAQAFDQNIGGWNVSNVVNMGAMFAGASAFNQDISGWNVSNVASMSAMFQAANSFNQPINSWNVSSVSDMSFMFNINSTFNQPIGGWDVSNVTTMFGMFWGAGAFNQDLGGWNVSSLENMHSMFEDAVQFNQDIGNWNVSNVTNMINTFSETVSFNQDISGWNTGNVIAMGHTFEGAAMFNQDIGNWDVSNVSTMLGMFQNAASFDQNLGNWDITNVNSMGDMLSGSGLSVMNYDATLIGWAGQSVQSGVTFGVQGLEYCAGETAREELINNHSWSISGDTISPSCGAFITLWNTNNDGTSNNDQITIPTTGSGYNYDVYWENFNDPTNNGTLSGLTGTTTITFPASGLYRVVITGDFPRIFFNNIGDKEKILEINQWGDIAWTTMLAAFWGCTNLQLKTLDAPDLSGVSTLSLMFANASSLNADLNHWDVSQVTDMFATFFGASDFNGDVSGWNVSNVTNLASTFKLASNFNQDIGLWNVGNVVDMSEMFYDAAAFNQDLDNWDTSNVQTMAYLFAGALAFDGVIGNWNTDSVTDMNNMFNSASVFNQDIGNWNITNVTDMDQMLDNSGLSTANYDATLIGWAGQSVQMNVPLGADGLDYCAGEAARNELINTHGWTITGDMLETGCSLITGSDQRVLASNQSEYIFPGSDFGIGNPAFSVKIEALPADGILLFEGNPVLAGNEILVADLNDGKLTWNAGTNSHGYEFTSFDFRIVDDMNNESNDAYTMSIDLAAAAVELTGGEGWRFMTSSAPGETFAGFLGPIWTQGIPGSNNPGASLPNLYQLDQANYQWQTISGMGNAIGQGEGFLLYVFEDDNNDGIPEGFPKTLTSMEGWDPLDGMYSYSGLFYDPNQGPEGDSHFLIANPHPVSVDFCEFAASNVATSIDIWDPAANGGNGDYINLNCIDPNVDVHIAPFQAFWVRTLASSPTLQIPESAYLGSVAPGYFKEKEPIQMADLFLRLNVQSEDGVFSNRVNILFSEEGTYGLDPADAPKLSATGLASRWLSFYALDEEGRGYAFRNLPADFDEVITIPMDIETTETGMFNLKLELPLQAEFTGNFWLRDNHTGAAMELKTGSNFYRFDVEGEEKYPNTFNGTENGQQVPGILLDVSSEYFIKHKSTSETPRFEFLVITADLYWEGELPAEVSLSQNYPNPFNPSTVIRYELPNSAHVRLEVFDILGRQVATLADGSMQAGVHQVTFDGSTHSSGVYLYRLVTGENVITRKLTLMK